jgi:cytoskeletal protein CcmA (bactofilin family)
MDGINKDTGPANNPSSEVSSLEEQPTVSISNSSANNDTATGLNDEIDSLEGSDSTSVVTNNPDQAPTTQMSPDQSPKQSGHHNPFERVARLFNVYLLLFILLFIIAIVASVVLYLKANEQANSTNSSSSQSLSQSELNQLANGDVTVGGPKSTLNVQSNAVFAGSVLIHSNLQIAGTLQVGSDAANDGLRVTGNSIFDDVQIDKSLALNGNGSILGQLNIQGNLSVSGTASFSGAVSVSQLTVGSLDLTGSLNLTHHINAGGSTPSRSYGLALGNGGSASVSGSDTAGSVSINTGSSPIAGCFLTITFSTPFNTTPHIVVTPVDSSGGGMQYYINRSTTNFSICSASTPPASASFGFDYIAFD